MIEDILAYNKQFVAEKGYEEFVTDKYPNKKLAIVTCMDTRLIELLPAALGIKNGDAKIIKNAAASSPAPLAAPCAVCSSPFTSSAAKRSWSSATPTAASATSTATA